MSVSLDVKVDISYAVVDTPTIEGFAPRAALQINNQRPANSVMTCHVNPTDKRLWVQAYSTLAYSMTQPVSVLYERA